MTSCFFFSNVAYVLLNLHILMLLSLTVIFLIQTLDIVIVRDILAH